MALKGKLDFIIAGTQKSGTTALHYFLEQHLCVAFPKKQELHFFDDDSHFVPAPDYSGLNVSFGKVPNGVITGECTPIYTYWKPSLGRIRDYNPSVKLVIILRNPIERSFSHWNMESRFGDESLDFIDAIAAEPSRTHLAPGGLSRHFSYVARGHYVEQIQRAFGLFPREQILVLRNDELRSEPLRIMQTVWRFLGLLPQRGLKVREKNTIPHECAMSQSEWTALREIFLPEIEQLEDLLGWDCSAWKRETVPPRIPRRKARYVRSAGASGIRERRLPRALLRFSRRESIAANLTSLRKTNFRHLRWMPLALLLLFLGYRFVFQAPNVDSQIHSSDRAQFASSKQTMPGTRDAQLLVRLPALKVEPGEPVPQRIAQPLVASVDNTRDFDWQTLVARGPVNTFRRFGDAKVVYAGLLLGPTDGDSFGLSVSTAALAPPQQAASGVPHKNPGWDARVALTSSLSDAYDPQERNGIPVLPESAPAGSHASFSVALEPAGDAARLGISSSVSASTLLRGSQPSRGSATQLLIGNPLHDLPMQPAHNFLPATTTNFGHPPNGNKR